jgi:RNA polymerase sigma-70 factor (ECF subfamily)
MHMDATASSILPELSTISLNTRPRTPEAAESDQQLMERFRAGDATAFDELYRRLRGPLRRFVTKLSSGHDEADEIVQEVWLAVIRGARTYRPAAKFTTYLFSIAYRRLQDHWRSHDRRAHAPLDEIADDQATLPEDWAARAELRSALLAAIDQLPPPQRAVFLLKVEADLSLEEIAAATEASVEATKSRLRYAVARLRAQLATWDRQETRSI